ncbi:MAG: hypothetical protein COT73_10740 [Bdellovibrio sp. CG10_big_fil_rev_8_21_14_0_10_47_8]|nr:MAG: hypothetical protein COT73_10740 [Bdellovibrio sp. CG10_big_fil_rev_8_21_14_0_10_47_8]
MLHNHTYQKNENEPICGHSDICSVCPWIDRPYEEQLQLKKNSLLHALQENQLISDFLPDFEIKVLTAGPFHVRDRVDLVYDQGHWGFYNKDRSGVFSVVECPLMSKDLFSFFQNLQKISIPIQKGSLRLRVAPPGNQESQTLKKPGLWLDFANKDIQFLFEEKTTLHQLMKLAVVEIGQRRKKLEWTGERFRLLDPDPQPWTRTWVSENSKLTPLSLNSTIGSFSQVGDQANQILIQELHHILQNIPEISHQSWVEFGCGNGNLTLPLAAHAKQVQALEFDSLSLLGFEKTLLQPEMKSWQEKIQLKQGDFQKRQEINFTSYQGILVNPPRSGLKDFLKPLAEIAENQRPRNMIYMSCFLESFILDARQIKSLGYHLQKISIIDQFPQSPHFEMMSWWSQI